LRAIVKNYLSKKKKLSDRGTQCISRSWKRKLENEGIQMILTSVRHPQANPAERQIREIIRMLRTLVHKQHNSWYKWIPYIEGCLNEVEHDTTGFCPIQLHLGRNPTRFWDQWVPKEKRLIDYPLILKIARKNIIKKGEQRRKAFNQKHIFTKFAEGELVLIKACNISNAQNKVVGKLFELYQGPFRITKQVAPHTFQLSHLEKNTTLGTYHTANLRKYHAATTAIIDNSIEDNSGHLLSSLNR